MFISNKCEKETVQWLILFDYILIIDMTLNAFNAKWTPSLYPGETFHLE